MRKIYFLVSGLITALTVQAQSGSQSFTASGIFVVPANVTMIAVELVGAGGSGGGNGGGGGGGGGYASGVYTVNPGDTIQFDVGTAGGGPNGGATNCAQLGITAYGGDNGVSVSNPNIGGGGAGGNANGGNVANNTGGDGGGGYWTYFGGGGGGAAGPAGNGSAGGNTIAWSGICQTPGGAAGAGGGAPGGDGGKGAGFTDANCNVTDPAGNGLNYGGGGGGGNGNGGNPGTGTGGYILFAWGPAAVGDLSAVNTIAVAPNPAAENISFAGIAPGSTLTIVNAIGEVVMTQQVTASRAEISLAEFAEGVYYYTVIENGNSQHGKFVVAR